MATFSVSDTKAQALVKLNKATSTKVIYGSGVAAMDSDIDTGGGTDDTEDLQAILDTASESNPLLLVLDGVALVKNLQLKSYTTLYTPQGGGLFQLDGSDTPIIFNKNPRNHLQGPRIDRHISVIGGVFNCNGNNQNANWEDGVSLGTNWFADIGVCGFAMYGVSNVILRDFEIRNSRFFNYYIANVIDMDARNIRCFYPVDSNTAWGIGNTDGFHVRGGQPSWTASATTANGDATVTVASTALLYAGLAVSGTGIAASTKILSITNATTFELTANATADGTPTLTFTERATGGLLVDGLTCINNHDDPLALDCADPGFDNPTDDPEFQPGNGYGSLIDSTFRNINCVGTPSSVRLLMNINRPEFTINNVLIENVNGGGGAMIFDGPVGNVTFRHIRDVGYIDCDNFTAEQLVFDDVHIDQLNAGRFIELNAGNEIDDLVLNNVRLTHTEATNAAFLRVSANNTVGRLTISNSLSVSSAPLVNNGTIGDLLVSSTITPAAARTLAGFVSGGGTVGSYRGDYFEPEFGVTYTTVADEPARLALTGKRAGSLVYQQDDGHLYFLWFAGNAPDTTAWHDFGAKTPPTLGPGSITSTVFWLRADETGAEDEDFVGTPLLGDQSGNGFNGSSAGTQRPVFDAGIAAINNRGALYFNGTSNTISLPQIKESAPLTVMVLAKMEADAGSFSAIIEWGSAALSLRCFGGPVYAQLTDESGGGDASIETNDAPLITDWVLWEFYVESNQITLRRNGTDIATEACVPHINFAPYIGSRGGASLFAKMRVAEVVAFSDDSEAATARAAIETYYDL